MFGKGTRTLIAILSVMVLSSMLLSGVSVAASKETRFVLTFVDERGTALPNVDCSAYGYDDDGNLTALDCVKSAKDGTIVVSANLNSISKREKNRYVHLTVKAFADGKEPVSLHWSADPENLSVSTMSVESISVITMKDLASPSLTARSYYPPTGIFRNRMASSEWVNGTVKVGELHFVPNLTAVFTYGQTSSATITGAIKYETQSWAANANSSVGVSSSYSGSKSSVGMTGSAYMAAPHRFNHEYWVREEMDGDVYDLWHVVSSWEEMVPLQYLGGMNDGGSVSGDGVTPNGDIVDLYYGESQTIGRTQIASFGGSWTYGGATMGASVTYSDNFSIVYSNNDTSGGVWHLYRTFRPYNNNPNRVWYATKIY